jgi:integrase
LPRLTAAFVRNTRKTGKYGDGAGLWLDISPGRRSWLLRFTYAGRERYMGLGSAADVTLAEARERAEAARRLIRDGIDPIAQRRAGRAAAIEAEARNVTFAEAMAHYLAAHSAAWRHPVTALQWRASLARYAVPTIGQLPCGAVETSHVLTILEPIWGSRSETASRVRGRIEAILSYATIRQWRAGPNPAVWRAHLQLLLPAKEKVAPVQHYAALDWREAPAFMRELRERPGMAAPALAFLILTAARSGEVRRAQWSEVDMERAVWTIAGERMKGGREHRVPLSAPALAILAAQHAIRDNSGLVFHGDRFGVPMSDMTLLAVLRRMARADLTAHGFRSTFRDWAAEATGHPNHVVEQALAHSIGSAVEAAYRRGDLFAKRVALMEDWAEYLAQPATAIVPLQRASI